MLDVELDEERVGDTSLEMNEDLLNFDFSNYTMDKVFCSYMKTLGTAISEICASQNFLSATVETVLKENAAIKEEQIDILNFFEFRIEFKFKFKLIGRLKFIICCTRGDKKILNFSRSIKLHRLYYILLLYR